MTLYTKSTLNIIRQSWSTQPSQHCNKTNKNKASGRIHNLNFIQNTALLN